MSDDARLQLAPIIKAWFWLHAASLIALLLQPSAPAEILGRYSKTAAGVILAFSLTLPLVWKITRWLPGRLDRFTSPWQPPAVLLLSAAALALLWFWPLGPTSSYLIIRLYLTAALLTGVLWSLQRLVLPAWSAHLPWALALASGALLLGLSTRFPGLLWTDEGYLISAALGFAQKGYPNVLMFQPAYVEWYSLIPLGMGRWFEATGVSVAAGRVFIFLIALASLGFTYAATRLAFSSPAAWPAVIIGAFALLQNNYLRPYIGVTLAVSAALAGIALATGGARPGRTCWRAPPWASAWTATRMPTASAWLSASPICSTTSGCCASAGGRSSTARWSTCSSGGSSVLPLTSCSTRLSPSGSSTAPVRPSPTSIRSPRPGRLRPGPHGDVCQPSAARVDRQGRPEL